MQAFLPIKMSSMTDCVFTVLSRMIGATARGFMSSFPHPKGCFPVLGCLNSPASGCQYSLPQVVLFYLSSCGSGHVSGRSKKKGCRLISFPSSSSDPRYPETAYRLSGQIGRYGAQGKKAGLWHRQRYRHKINWENISSSTESRPQRWTQSEGHEK